MLSDGSLTLVENTCLEINALKFACNMGSEEVRAAVVPVLVGAVHGLTPSALTSSSSLSSPSYSARVQEVI